MAKKAPESNDPLKAEGLSVEESETQESVVAGLKLHVTKWIPKAPPRALLFVCHGVAEHMGRYKLLAEQLCSSGILVFGHDHVGHGKSDGDRVHVENYDTYVQDVIKTVQKMKDQFPALPCILMGHSMGGLVAGLTALSRQELFTGLILSAALAEIDPKSAGWLLQTVTKVLAFLSPQFGIKKVPCEDVSSVIEEVEAYNNDELVYHGEIKAKWGLESMRAIDRLRGAAKDIKLPLLLIHGTDDHIVPLSSSQFLFEKVQSTEVQFERFQGSRHEVFHDIEQRRARDIVELWISKLAS